MVRTAFKVDLRWMEAGEEKAAWTWLEAEPVGANPSEAATTN
jgi:hypothetical protein